jgi:hypothetical protein
LLIVTAGLYTHYAYPLILLVVVVPRLWRREGLWRWLAWQIIPFLLYLPWLPTAWRQVTTWPATPQDTPWPAALEVISATLLFGHSWPFGGGLAVLGVILLLSLWTARRWPAAWLWLWLLLPVGLTVLTFSPAFLKFLLVASPALVLLTAAAIERLPRPAGATLLAGLAAASLLSLYGYYTDPAYARDNYRGIVQFIRAVSGPKDAIILHAEGQQDVFNYYYDAIPAPKAPVYPLPRRRPLDEAATLDELTAIAHRAPKIYAVYWATRQADPAGLIEGWLDAHLFKATDQWYGNVRLVSYAGLAAGDVRLTPLEAQVGEQIRLTAYSLSPAQITPGDILGVALQWETAAPLPTDYTLFIQALDAGNHLAGQRDARLTTSTWPVRSPVVETHGLFIEPGTPPGQYRLIAGLYDDDGRRLPTGAGQTFVTLGAVEVIRPAAPLPLEAFKMQTRLDQPLLGVTLLGYDLHKLGAPEAPLQPGDPLHVVAYWQAHESSPNFADQVAIQVVTAGGTATPVSATSRLSGGNYPLAAWQAGEVVRAQYDLFLSGLPPGRYRLALTVGTAAEQATALTAPFRVGGD